MGGEFPLQSRRTRCSTALGRAGVCAGARAHGRSEILQVVEHNLYLHSLLPYYYWGVSSPPPLVLANSLLACLSVCLSVIISAVWSDAKGRQDALDAWAEAGRRVLDACGVAEFDLGVFNMVFQNFGGGVWEPVFLEALDMAMRNLPAKKWVHVSERVIRDC